MLENDLQSRTELTSMSYAAEVFLRMVNLYRGCLLYTSDAADEL